MENIQNNSYEDEIHERLPSNSGTLCQKNI